jgi:hypothetical protein
VVERADTVFVAVGSNATLDLDEVFAGVAQTPLTYRVLESVGNAEVELRGERGRFLFALATDRRADVLLVEARMECGAMARGHIAVHAVAPGTVCSMPPRSVSPPQVTRVAKGGVAAIMPLWGEGGLFQGAFDVDATFATAHEGDRVVVAVARGEPHRLHVTGRAAGAATVRVTATDACFRHAEVDVPVEVVDSPTCSVIFDPGAAVYFPLEAGTQWRYERRNNGAVTGQTIWVLNAVSACTNGQRVLPIYQTDLSLDGSVVGTLAHSFTIAGDTLRGPSGWPQNMLWRREAGAAADSYTYSSGAGYPWPGSSATLRRDVGVSSFASTSGSHHFPDTVSRILIEGPIYPP